MASKLDAPELLRYRSNLLGSDLRITNFGGGNTSRPSSSMTDPVGGKPVTVLWVKGSGGDLGSIKRSGFATLVSRSPAFTRSAVQGRCRRRSAMVGAVPAGHVQQQSRRRLRSIRRCMDFCPFPHVDHLHPDWGIALAASANGKQKMDEFNAEFGHKLAWLPWQRPGFELGMMLAQDRAKTRLAVMALCSAATACSPGATRSASAT